MGDGKFFEWLSRLGDLFLLSVIYVISCIPIVTAGASTTALYYTTLKIAEKKESYVWQDFQKSFKQNFKQATIIWIIFFAACAAVAADFVLAGGLSVQLGTIVAITMVVAAIFLALLGLYVFPLLARFENTVAGTMKNAVLIAVRHLPSTILIALIHAVPLFVAFVSITAFIRGFAVIMLFAAAPLAYLESKLFIRIFYHYYPKTACAETLS